MTKTTGNWLCRIFRNSYSQQKLVAALLRLARVTVGLAAAYARFITHVTCRLTAKNLDQLREVVPPGGKGEASPYGWTSKNYVICVCFPCITRLIHCTAVEQRATLIHRQYNRDWGTSYSRPPIDPYLTSLCYKILAAPLLRNPTLGNRVWATFTLPYSQQLYCRPTAQLFQQTFS